MPKGKVVSDDVRGFVGELLSQDEKLTGKELKNKVEDGLKGINYTIRTYQNIKDDLKPILEKIRASQLDRPWSIGASGDIPADIIPVLMKLQSRLDKISEDRELFQNIKTKYKALLDYDMLFIPLRTAKWISKLYPMFLQIARDKGNITDINAIDNPEDDQVLNWLHPTAGLYARFEKIAQILNIPLATGALDEVLFMPNGFFDLNLKEKIAVSVIWTTINVQDFKRHYQQKDGAK